MKIKLNNFLKMSVVLVLILSVSPFIIAAKSADTGVFPINLSYLETPADNQFSDALKVHFGVKPNSKDKIVGSVKFTDSNDNAPKELPLQAVGHGSVHINGEVYPFNFNEPVGISVTPSGKTFYHGTVAGNLKTNKGDNVIADFTILAIPDEDKMLITIGADAISDNPAGLAFGNKFEEIDQWMSQKFGEGGK